MPRGPREWGESLVQHVMIRGINQVQLFYDDEDRVAFLDRVRRFKRECGFELYAWCLMGNHVHLLISEHDAGLPVIMKKLLLSYSSWYNLKYDRSGYLYQDRYKSKVIGDDSYLLAAVRYIHRNPLEAGGNVATWTSYNDYIGQSGPGITDTGFILGALSEDDIRAQHAFVELITGDEAPCRYSFPQGSRRMRDQQAMDLIMEVAGVDSCAAVCDLESAARDNALAELRARGLSIRQIARLTGLNRGVVERAGRNVSRKPSP